MSAERILLARFKKRPRKQNSCHGFIREFFCLCVTIVKIFFIP